MGVRLWAHEIIRSEGWASYLHFSHAKVAGAIFIANSNNSFCQFVLREEHRAQYLRQLIIPDIYTYEDDDEDIEYTFGALATVLQRATKLELLNIEKAEGLLVYPPSMSAAISSCATLTELKLSMVGKRAQKMLRRMHSPVTSARLEYYDEEEMLYDPLKASLRHPDPTRTLKNFSATLSRLRVISSGQHFADTFTGPQFCHVRELTIVTGKIHINLAAFMTSFPRVSRLTWHDEREQVQEDAQAEHFFNMQFTNELWPNLDSIYATVLSCYTSGLQSRVRLWRLGHVDAANKIPFQVTMGLLRPTAVQIYTTAAMLDGEDALQLFPPNDIKSLNIHVDLDIGDPTKTASVISTTLLLLQGMPLTLLALSFHHKLHHTWIPIVKPDRGDTAQLESDSDDGIGHTYGEDTNRVDPVRDCLDSMDVEAYARMLIAAIPTLKHLGFAFQGSFSQGNRTYRGWKHSPLFLQVLRSEEGDVVEIQTMTDKDGDRLFEDTFQCDIWQVQVFDAFY
ncbi:hypothetical protein BXZ70DRAFT_1062076 [Cristinia sonorae]|uniref:Uncharacterized protein n=1 Tax=Cristinia sonorae TaxID=1940300 RepID=A0A8K0XSQ6_9AGAR|nr:hypothetical protein BXZ70DRAFT_1062076 [Cristinia sonorae]